MKWAVNKLRHYLYGTKFKVYTDHQALSYLMSMKEPRGMMAKCQAALQAYDFEIAYCDGRIIPHADALSQAPLVAAWTFSGKWSTEDLHTHQLSDPDILQVR